MKRSHAVLCVLAAVHVAMAAYSTTRKNVAALPGVGKPAGVYASLSGADNRFGFFAPGVAAQLRLKITARGADGAQAEEIIQAGNATEMDFRLGTIIGMLKEDKMQPLLAASWAGQTFGKYPDAAEVVVEIQYYLLPMMKYYKEGHRPKWVTFYEATYAPATGEEGELTFDLD